MWTHITVYIEHNNAEGTGLYWGWLGVYTVRSFSMLQYLYAGSPFADLFCLPSSIYPSTVPQGYSYPSLAKTASEHQYYHPIEIILLGRKRS